MGKRMQLPLRFEAPGKTDSSAVGVPIDKHFPEDEANTLARLESYNKHLYRPNTYLHKWWARRSGTTFRHILKQLVKDQRRRHYYEPGGLEGQTILDPMMGGGTILHEAIRLGANVIGIDIDPIPVLQARATLALSDVSHRKRVYRNFSQALKARLHQFYAALCPVCGQEAETQFVLYGLRKRCSCREVLVLDGLTIREDSPHDVVICPSCCAVTATGQHECAQRQDVQIITKGTNVCELCGGPFEEILDQPFFDRYCPLVLVVGCRDHGQIYASITGRDLECLAAAREQVERLEFRNSRDFLVPSGPKSDDLLRRRVESFVDVFTPRQLLYIHACRRLLMEVPEDDKLWLGLLVSTSLEFNSLLCGYKGGSRRRPGAIRHVFSHHAYSFPYTALENNPLFSGKTSGTLNRLFHDRIVRAGHWASAPIETRIGEKGSGKITLIGEIDGGHAVSEWDELKTRTRRFLLLQADSGRADLPPDIADHVVTDPPYYDSVQYSDLSSFFRVWLQVLLPEEADWNYDYSSSAVCNTHTGVQTTYRDVLTEIWGTCSHALKKNGRLIFTFHHWRAEAWAELTISLRRAGFRLVNRYVVASENPTSVHIRDLRAIKHDTILVLAREAEDSPGTQWHRPHSMNFNDSHAFCRDCGSVLGWLLQTEREEPQIYSEWERFLGGQDRA